MSCDYDIELEVIVDQDYANNTVLGHFLQVTAQNAIFNGEPGDTHVFLYQREISDPEDGHLVSFNLVSGGSGYSNPTAVISGGGGQGATAKALTIGPITAINVSSGGTGYTAVPLVEITGQGSGATATAVLSATGAIKKILVTAGGTGYDNTLTVSVTEVGGTGATAKARVVGGAVVAIDVLTSGSGYVSPTVTISGGGGSGATATGVVGRSIASVNVTAGGSGYVEPTILATGGGGTGAVLSPVVTGPIHGLLVTDQGHHYTANPTVQITGGGTGANVTSVLDFYGSYFTAICTPNDLQEVLETSEPTGPGPEPAKFRLNYVRAYFRSRAEAEYAKTAILVDVNALLNALRLQCTERHGDPIVFKISAR
jgi:hypothetical protein